MEDSLSDIQLRELNITEAESDVEEIDVKNIEQCEIEKAETASVTSSTNDSGSGDINNEQAAVGPSHKDYPYPQKSVYIEPVVMVTRGMRDESDDDWDDAANFDSNSDSASASGVSAEWSECTGDIRRVELQEGRRGFGFSISGGVMSPLGHVPLFVASVDQHGHAAKTSMRPGDRIIAINGENMEGKSHRDAIIAIKSACGPVTLDLTEGEDNILDFIVMD